MGVIIQKILFIGEKSDEEVEVLFDSGATYSFVRKEMALKLDYFSKNNNKFVTTQMF